MRSCPLAAADMSQNPYDNDYSSIDDINSEEHIADPEAKLLPENENSIRKTGFPPLNSEILCQGSNGEWKKKGCPEQIRQGWKRKERKIQR